MTVDVASASFAGRLRTLREQRGLTQEELAQRAGLTTHAVSALERGARTRPYPHTVRSLAQALALDDSQRAALLTAVPPRASATGRRPEPEGPGIAPLPRPATGLLGRDDEVARLADLLRQDDVRLVTLTGLGGVGKSRLALEVARLVAPSLPDGAVWVPLAALAQAALVLPAIGHAAGLTGVEGLDAPDVVAAGLREARLLLVVDNLEHVLDAAPGLGELLEACPGLVVLATSRAALRLRGEREHAVQPLGLPHGTGAAAVVAASSALLFAERARAVDADFVVDEDNAQAVADLCRRLAGIPLALELAAAKVRLLEPAQLLDRLDAVMTTGGARDLPPRQRTLQATLDWSYGLLGPEDRRLFRRLGVLTGGFTLEAAEAVSGGEVLGPLERLLEHSLVRAEGDGSGSVRYQLLEPVLQYARRTLAADPDEEREARLAHVRFFLQLAEALAPSFRRAEAVQAMTVTGTEQANLVTAIEHALTLGEQELAGRMCWALWLDWWLRGHLLAGRRFAERALEQGLTGPTRVRALLTRAAMAFAQGDLETAATWADATRAARELGDVDGEGSGVAGEGLVALARGDLDAAEGAFRASLPLAEQMDDDHWLWTLAHVWLGTIALLRGAADDALVLVDTALTAARARGDRLATYIALFTAAQAAISAGHSTRAREQLVEGIRLSRETGDLSNLAYFLDALAVVASRTGDPVRVATLLAAAEALRAGGDRVVYSYYQPDAALRAQAEASARAALGEDAYEDAVDAGRGLDLEELTAYAVQGGRPEAVTA